MVDNVSIPDITNAIMVQKNYIITSINMAQDSGELLRASMQIDLVEPLWAVVGYAYKVVELRQKIREKANYLLKGEQSYLVGCRANDKTRASTENHIRRLQELAA